MVDLAVEASTGNTLLDWGQYGGQNNIAPMNMISTNNGTFAQTYAGIIAIDSLGNFIKKSIGSLCNPETNNHHHPGSRGSHL